MTSAPLGVGIVGTGNISMTYLRNAALFPGVRLIACADVSAESAAARAAEYGIRAVPADVLLADPEVDLVLNLTIPAAHVEVSLAALSAGKHVFTEKPLATTAADGRRLVAEASAARPTPRVGARHLPRRRRATGAPAGRRGRDRASCRRHGVHAWPRDGALASQSAVLLRAGRRAAVRHGPLLSHDARQPPWPRRLGAGRGDEEGKRSASSPLRDRSAARPFRSARRRRSCRCSPSWAAQW